MAITNHERVGKALELLKAGLGPFIEREFKNDYQGRAAAQAAQFLGEDRLLASTPAGQKDADALLNVVYDQEDARRCTDICRTATDSCPEVSRVQASLDEWRRPS